jgi:hypothetical protein
VSRAVATRRASTPERSTRGPEQRDRLVRSDGPAGAGWVGQARRWTSSPSRGADDEGPAADRRVDVVQLPPAAPRLGAPRRRRGDRASRTRPSSSSRYVTVIGANDIRALASSPRALTTVTIDQGSVAEYLVKTIRAALAHQPAPHFVGTRHHLGRRRSRRAQRARKACLRVGDRSGVFDNDLDHVAGRLVPCRRALLVAPMIRPDGAGQEAVVRGVRPAVSGFRTYA